MPRLSERGIALRNLKKRLQTRFLAAQVRRTNGIHDESEDELDDMVYTALQVVESHRYFRRRQYRRRTLCVFERDLRGIIHPLVGDELPWLNENEFIQKYRMSPGSFLAMLDLIKDHEVFSSPDGGRPQAPAAHQLMVLLKYLGTEGSGCSNPDLRNVFHVGRGTCQLYRERALTAIRSLQDTTVTWPDQAERSQIAQRIQKDFNFPNCVGLIDGTLFPLAITPQSKDAPEYFGRKHGYSFSTMIICDDQRLIRYYYSGWPGSVHDNRIFKNTTIFTNPDNFFDKKQYILGDSAFENHSFMVSSYRSPQGQPIAREKEVFNHAMSKPRVISEHTIGILKGRFQWLRLVRMVVKQDLESVRKVLRYFDACVILHNLLTKQHDEIPEEWMDDNDVIDDADSPLESDDEINRAVPLLANSDERRRQLTAYINEVHVM
jgi:hypothetical protein